MTLGKGGRAGICGWVFRRGDARSYRVSVSLHSSPCGIRHQKTAAGLRDAAEHSTTPHETGGEEDKYSHVLHLTFQIHPPELLAQRLKPTWLPCSAHRHKRGAGALSGNLEFVSEMRLDRPKTAKAELSCCCSQPPKTHSDRHWPSRDLAVFLFPLQSSAVAPSREEQAKKRQKYKDNRPD